MVVRGHQYDSFERNECIVECLDRFEVEVVGRRVEQQCIGLLDHHPGDHATHLLAARKDVYLLVNLFAAEKHLTQVSPQVEFAGIV